MANTVAAIIDRNEPGSATRIADAMVDALLLKVREAINARGLPAQVAAELFEDDEPEDES